MELQDILNYIGSNLKKRDDLTKQAADDSWSRVKRQMAGEDVSLAPTPAEEEMAKNSLGVAMATTQFPKLPLGVANMKTFTKPTTTEMDLLRQQTQNIGREADFSQRLAEQTKNARIKALQKLQE